MPLAHPSAAPISVRTYELPPLIVQDQAAVSVRVVYACPHCAQRLRIRPEYFGATLACKHCDVRFVPSLARAVSSRPDHHPTGATAPGSSRSPHPGWARSHLATG